MVHSIGPIGCGGIASAWIRAVAAEEDARIALAFDLSREAAEQRAAETGAEAVAALEQIWDRDDVSIVVIGTPTASHPELVEQAAQAGKHIMCEKPMALDLDACRRMIAAAEAAGVKLAIGHTLRFMGAFLTCRRLVADGAIGAPVSGSVDRMGTAAPHRAGVPQASRQWRDDPANTGGMALETFIHELDFARAVFGEVASICCEVAGGSEYDGLLSPQILQGLVKFESGALVTARTGSTVALPTRGYWIGGTEGGLYFSAWNGSVAHYRHDRDEPKQVPAAEGYAHQRELRDLLAAIATGSEPENSGVNGLKSVALGLGMYRSFETGRRVECVGGLPADLAGDYRNTRWW